MTSPKATSSDAGLGPSPGEARLGSSSGFPATPALPPAAILLVDDDARNLRLLDAVLHPLGIRHVIATSGPEAIERASETDFAVILLDVQMPGMDGFDTAAHLKRVPRARTTPILFLTATVNDAVVVKAYARGAVDYITKPFDADILRSKVAVFVELFQAKELVRRQAAILSERERSDLLAREQLARAEADKQVERLRLLADAGIALAISLERDVILEALAEALVPRFADLCTFDVVETREDAGASLVLAAVAHRSEVGAASVRRVRAEVPVERGAQRGLFHAFETGDAELYDQPLDPALPLGEPLGTLFRDLGMTSAIVVPLRAHGEVLGVMTVALGADTGRTAYTLDDLRLTESIAVRAAVGLVNARLHLEARDAIRLRDDFLSVASHELRTPLTSLRLTIEGLQRAPAIEPKLAGKLATAERQVGRLTDLIGQLLDVSRIVGGRLRLDLEEVDLSNVVREVVARFQDQLARSGSLASVDVPPRVVGLWDALRIEQVITNLLSNAIKYGQGKPIAVAVDASGDAIVLTVTDHGIGIARDDQARIFERFERAVSIRHYGGFGLGLWITRQIVEALGGTVRVESVPGEGSCFRVTLPRVSTGNVAPSRP